MSVPKKVTVTYAFSVQEALEVSKDKSAFELAIINELAKKGK